VTTHPQQQQLLLLPHSEELPADEERDRRDKGPLRLVLIGDALPVDQLGPELDAAAFGFALGVVVGTASGIVASTVPELAASGAIEPEPAALGLRVLG